jgi:hypothetical protein
LKSIGNGQATELKPGAGEKLTVVVVEVVNVVEVVLVVVV